MNFYQDLGTLMLGTRLKRLSDSFLNDVNKFYQQIGIDFDASWFPIFYLLSKQESLTIRDIADQLQVSHSAISQLVTNLQKKGYVKVKTSSTDARAKEVMLSAKGTQRLLQVQPIWLTLQETMKILIAENTHLKHLLSSITAFEDKLLEKSLIERLNEQYHLFESK